MYSNIKRFYTELPLKLNNIIKVDDKQHHYLKNVLRIKSNDLVRFFNGKEGEWLAKVIKVERKYTSLSIQKNIGRQKQSPNLWLFFSPIKSDRLNILVQKSTELGVSKFIPVKTERSNMKNINYNNLRKNAIEASEQSTRLDVPIIEKELKVDDINRFLSVDRCVLYCDEKNINANNIINTLNKIAKNFSKWSLLIGPEGGFSLEERKKILKFLNVYPITLGKRILRSETAAVAGLFCIQQFIDN